MQLNSIPANLLHPKLHLPKPQCPYLQPNPPLKKTILKMPTTFSLSGITTYSASNGYSFSLARAVFREEKVRSRDMKSFDSSLDPPELL